MTGSGSATDLRRAFVAGAAHGPWRAGAPARVLRFHA